MSDAGRLELLLALADSQAEQEQSERVALAERRVLDGTADVFDRLALRCALSRLRRGALSRLEMSDLDA